MRIFQRFRHKWLRWLILVALFVFAYQFYWLTARLDWSAFGQALVQPGNWRFFALALLLMPLNWFLELGKWHTLLRPFLPWSWARTRDAMLAGIAASAVTPNRVGEVGGRMVMGRSEEWPGIVASTVLGALTQWVAFLSLAWPALVLALDVRGVLPLPPGYLLPVGPLLVLIGAWGGKPLLLRIVDWLDRRLERDLNTLRTALTNVNFRLMLRASTYACLRFGVYCTQLYCLLWFFGLRLPPVNGLAGVAAIYLVQAGLPLPPGLNLLGRTELGMLLWQTEAAGSVAILAAYTALYGINVLLPALPGYWLVLRKNDKL